KFGTDKIGGDGMEVHSSAGSIERRHLLSEEACDHTCQYIACSGCSQCGIRQPVDACASIRFRDDCTGTFQHKRHLPFFCFVACQFQAVDIATRHFQLTTKPSHLTRMGRNHCSRGQPCPPVFHTG